MGRHQETGKRQGFSLREQLGAAGLTDLSPASVVQVNDKKLSFPHNLINRTVHELRVAIVLSNDLICSSRAHPLVVIVPMTHDTSIVHETDCLVKKTPTNGLRSDSLAQLHLIQPLLKKEVLNKIGTLDNADWEKILEKLVWMTDRA